MVEEDESSQLHYIRFVLQRRKWKKLTMLRVRLCAEDTLHSQAVLFFGLFVCLQPGQRCNQGPAHSTRRVVFVIVSSLRNTNNSICLASYVFKASPPVDWHSWNSAAGFAVSLSRDAGRLTALMAVKISGRMLTLEKATGNGRGWKREFTT